ncbi:lipoyl(octanoyl) transferase LipB [Bryobacter aggregatus]|uniref:lipoyl(octanoyl) transferase LipB n=1 Tax=Bryobacter aggregatus TaxID=360054 RepID=UPI0004E12FDF|nr:lipoyl(octanoyl) transferase LipB [Bryobacter aggregatus]
MPDFDVIDLGPLPWAEAWSIQQSYVEKRKAGLVPDTLLFVEHPHVITLGRNASESNILAGRDQLARLGIEVHEANRGGDVTYHGPGQLVGYPIFELTRWKKDVRAYVQGVEQAVIRTLAGFGIEAHTRTGKETGVYVQQAGLAPAKICALGVHISRWVTSHGFALNINTDLRYFQYIVPCGLTLPVTSMEALGVTVQREEVMRVLSRHLAEIFHHEFTDSIENLQEMLPCLMS